MISMFGICLDKWRIFIVRIEEVIIVFNGINVISDGFLSNMYEKYIFIILK